MEKYFATAMWLALFVAAGPAFGQPSAAERAEADKLYEQSLVIRRDWKTAEDYQQGLDLMRAVLRKDPAHERAFVDNYLVNYFRRTGIKPDDFKIMSDMLRDFIKTNPKTYAPKYLLAYLLMWKDHETRPEQYYEQEINGLIDSMLTAEPGRGDGYLARAFQHMYARKIDSAISLVDQALEKPLTDRAEAHYLRAFLFSTGPGLHRAALADLKRASDIIDGELKAIPKLYQTDYRGLARWKIHMRQAICHHCLGNAGESEKSTELAAKLGGGRSEAILKDIKAECDRRDQDIRVAWDEFSTSLEKSLIKPKGK